MSETGKQGRKRSTRTRSKSMFGCIRKDFQRHNSLKGKRHMKMATLVLALAAALFSGQSLHAGAVDGPKHGTCSGNDIVAFHGDMVAVVAVLQLNNQGGKVEIY